MERIQLQLQMRIQLRGHVWTKRSSTNDLWSPPPVYASLLFLFVVVVVFFCLFSCTRSSRTSLHRT